jgi:hypothetical protein
LPRSKPRRSGGWGKKKGIHKKLLISIYNLIPIILILNIPLRQM